MREPVNTRYTICSTQQLLENKNRIKWSMKVWEIIEFRISVDNTYQLDTLL